MHEITLPPADLLLPGAPSSHETAMMARADSPTGDRPRIKSVAFSGDTERAVGHDEKW